MAEVHGPIGGPVYPAQVVPELAPGWQRPRRSVWNILGWLLVLVILMGSLLLNVGLWILLLVRTSELEEGIVQRHYSHTKGAPNRVVILTVQGALVGGENFFKKQMDLLRKDERVKAIVLRINSPGGLVSVADFMLHHLQQLGQERKIPIVVSMGGMAASGGYYVAMAVGEQADCLFAEPTTFTGSIGVIIPHYDLSQLLEKWGVKEDSIASHPLKGMGSITRPMTEQERQIFQGLVDDAFRRFKEVVKQGRPKFRADPEALDKLATGQLFTAQQALEHGLIDKIGYLEDAIERAIQLAGLAPEEVEVLRYERQPTLGELLFGADAAAGRLDLAALLDSTAPRAYYLCTRLPPLVSSYPSGR